MTSTDIPPASAGRSPTFDEVWDAMDRSPLVLWGIGIMFAGGLGAAIAGFAGATGMVLVGCALLVPLGAAVSGSAIVTTARSLGAGWGRTAWFTVRAAVRALYGLVDLAV